MNMKLLLNILILFGLFIPTGIYAQIDKTAILKHENDVLSSVFKQNKIRGYIDKKYDYIDGKPADTVFEYELVQIDTSGNITQSAVFNKTQELKNLNKIVSDQNNKVKKTYTFENKSLLYKTEIYYDIYDRPVEEIETDDFGAVHAKKRNTFNTTSNPIKTIVRGPSGTVTSEAGFFYDSQDHLTKQDFKNEGKVISSLDLEYENGKMIGWKHIDDKYKTVKEKIFTYDGDLPIRFEITENGIPYRVNRTYFSQGQEPQLIEKILIIPDFGKYYKETNPYSQNFVYQTPPSFPGGKDALIKYIKDHLKYPKILWWMKSGILPTSEWIKALSTSWMMLLLIWFKTCPNGNRH
jgi:hypothetical protein